MGSKINMYPIELMIVCKSFDMYLKNNFVRVIGYLKTDQIKNKDPAL